MHSAHRLTKVTSGHFVKKNLTRSYANDFTTRVDWALINPHWNSQNGKAIT